MVSTAQPGGTEGQRRILSGADSRPWQWPFSECQIQYLRVDVSVRAGGDDLGDADRLPRALNRCSGTVLIAALFDLVRVAAPEPLALWAVAWGAATPPYVASDC
jgi:hypothetical protein